MGREHDRGTCYVHTAATFLHREASLHRVLLTYVGSSLPVLKPSEGNGTHPQGPSCGGTCTLPSTRALCRLTTQPAELQRCRRVSGMMLTRGVSAAGVCTDDAVLRRTGGGHGRAGRQRAAAGVPSVEADAAQDPTVLPGRLRGEHESKRGRADSRVAVSAYPSRTPPTSVGQAATVPKCPTAGPGVRPAL